MNCVYSRNHLALQVGFYFIMLFLHSHLLIMGRGNFLSRRGVLLYYQQKFWFFYDLFLV